MKINKLRFYLIPALLIFSVLTGLYWGVHSNYFYMDDFHWVARAILVQDSPGEMFSIEGRDFNPVFLVLLALLIKIFGVSPFVLRIVSVLTLSGVIFTFFHILSHHFKIQRMFALCAALLLGMNVFISEVVLNLSALVYVLSMLLALLAITFYLDKKKWLFVLFMVLAFFTKETIILVMLPLFIYEREKSNRLFLAAVFGAAVLLRLLLQLGATSGYTNFFSISNSFYKFYFIVVRSMSLSPYSIHLAVGIAVMAAIFFICGYFVIAKKERGFMFFVSLFAAYALFFAVLPKLSSRYVLFPSVGFWGIAALLTHYFHKQKESKKIKYALVPLVLISLLFNFLSIQREVEDYRILGDFSKAFIQREGAFIKSVVENQKEGSEITLFKGGNRQLALVYQKILERDNLPKLLPFRSHSIGGVIEPRHLVPIVFYPDSIARWLTKEETDHYFRGNILKNR
jgi:hypothetical protein